MFEIIRDPELWRKNIVSNHFKTRFEIDLP